MKNIIYFILLFLLSCDDQSNQQLTTTQTDMKIRDQALLIPQLDQKIIQDQTLDPRLDQALDQATDQALDQMQVLVDQQIISPPIMDQSVQDFSTVTAMDSDGDGLIDERDLDPLDANWPGKAKPDTIYAHTARTLFALDVKSDQLIRVNDFSFDPQYATEQITDIAFDQNNVLWAVSFRKLFICHAQTVVCRYQGELPSTFNGLTWINGNIIGQADEILVGIEREGSWYHLSVNQGQVNSRLIGEYPPARLSSGDAFYIENIGTFAAIEYLLADGNQIVTIDPQNPSLVNEVFVTLNGYRKIYGLAGWRGFLYAFDESGAVLKINIQDRSFVELDSTREAWWGAGVSTILYSNP